MFDSWYIILCIYIYNIIQVYHHLSPSLQQSWKWMTWLLERTWNPWHGPGHELRCLVASCSASCAFRGLFGWWPPFPQTFTPLLSRCRQIDSNLSVQLNSGRRPLGQPVLRPKGKVLGNGTPCRRPPPVHPAFTPGSPPVHLPPCNLQCFVCVCVRCTKHCVLQGLFTPGSPPTM